MTKLGHNWRHQRLVMLNAQRPLPHRSQPLTRIHLIFCHSCRCTSILLSGFYSFCIERTIDVQPDLVALCLLKRLFIQVLTDSNPLREFFQQTFVIDMHCDTLKLDFFGRWAPHQPGDFRPRESALLPSRCRAKTRDSASAASRPTATKERPESLVKG
jgi:hypothetical protein